MSYCLLHFIFFLTLQAAMTYAEAQMLIDDCDRQDDIPKSIRNLNSLAKKLKQKRLDAG